MGITVRKATEADKAEMLSKPVWECEASEFDWHYDSDERFYLVEGEVTVTYDGGWSDASRPARPCNLGSVSFEAGDYVVTPKGLSCVWKVSKAVKKHYEFN
jgi:uncharacterized cupin superfamily protein